MYTYGKGLGTALTEMYARRIIEMNIDFEKIRKEEWPVLETMTFLDAACVSFAPQRTVKAVKAFADKYEDSPHQNLLFSPRKLTFVPIQK